MKQPNGAANFQDIEMYHWRVNFKPDKFYVATASDAMKGLIIARVVRLSFRLSAKPDLLLYNICRDLMALVPVGSSKFQLISACW